MDSLLLYTAIEGFLLALAAEGKSPHTVSDYRGSLRRLQGFLGKETPVAEISRDDVRRFMASLNGELAAKTRRNVHTGLSAFWTWAVVEGYAPVHLMRGIEAPRAPAPVIEPFTETEIQAVLQACQATRAWVSRGGETTTTRRATALRDRALVLFLLDTGVRASECCGLRVGNMTLDRGRALITQAKGKKQRVVFFGKRTRQALWRYWASRTEMDEEAPAFATVLDGERAMSRDVLYRLLRRIGERGQVANVHPHRFRHTFAITYLRNGGDIFTLQTLLGHSTLDMVRHYARIAECDTERVHEIASPVDNWRL